VNKKALNFKNPDCASEEQQPEASTSKWSLKALRIALEKAGIDF
jgi:hypothetical protein